MTAIAGFFFLIPDSLPTLSVQCPLLVLMSVPSRFTRLEGQMNLVFS